VVPWRRGLKLHLFPHNETCELVYLTGRYEPNETHWLESVLRPGMTFVDIGANLGMFTLLAAACVGPGGRVIALEPSKRERERLEANVKLNGFANVRVIAAATSDVPGNARLHVAREPNSGHNTLGAFIYDVREELAEEVELIRLDDAGIDHVDVMKLDVEGAEVKALRGAARLIDRCRPTVLVEVNDRSLGNQGHRSAEVWEFFLSRGYSMHGFDEASGKLVPVTQLERYADSVNLVAVPEVKP
jgi:FkbM family methyltransferase